MNAYSKIPTQSFAMQIIYGVFESIDVTSAKYPSKTSLLFYVRMTK